LLTVGGCGQLNRVELGAGIGLVGLAVATGCHVDSPVYITDQKSMLALMQENIERNELSPIVRAAVLDWGSPLPPLIPPSPSVILAADCVYFEPAFPLLISTLEYLLGSDSVCYFCFKKRRRADVRFIKQAKKKFDVLKVTGQDIYGKENRIFLYILTKKDLD
jgi:hypothetical protein